MPSSSSGVFVWPFDPPTTRLLPIRWVDANLLKLPFTGSEKTTYELVSPVHNLVGIFNCGGGVSAAVQTINGKWVHTSVPAFFNLGRNLVLFNTITKQSEDG